MVEIPLNFKLQESNSRITKIRCHLMPPTPLDKIQTFNRLKIVSERILHQFFKIFGEGEGACVAPWILPTQEKKKLLRVHIIPCKWGENSRITYPAQRGFHDKSEFKKKYQQPIAIWLKFLKIYKKAIPNHQNAASFNGNPPNIHLEIRYKRLIG